MTIRRHLYQGRRWRVGRLVVGILLVALVSRIQPLSVLPSAFLLVGVALILSAVPWKKLPWRDIYATIQHQKLSFEISGFSLLKTQKQNYPNWLSITATELTTDIERGNVNATFELSNDLLWDLSLVELQGSARLDAQTVSQDFGLSQPVSSYRFRRLRPSKIKVNFPVESGIFGQLNDKREQQNKAYWEFELQWKLKFSSGEEVTWQPKEIHFEEVPRIERVNVAGM